MSTNNNTTTQQQEQDNTTAWIIIGCIYALVFIASSFRLQWWKVRHSLWLHIFIFFLWLCFLFLLSCGIFLIPAFIFAFSLMILVWSWVLWIAVICHPGVPKPWKSFGTFFGNVFLGLQIALWWIIGWEWADDEAKFPSLRKAKANEFKSWYFYHLRVLHDEPHEIDWYDIFWEKTGGDKGYEDTPEAPGDPADEDTEA